MTLRAFERISAGATMNYAGSDLFEIVSQDYDPPVRAVYSRGDEDSDSLIVIGVSEKTDFLPERLREHRDAAYHRMLSFVQRSATYPVILPRGWKQYKSDNLVTFFALPESFGSTLRWVTEVNASGSGDLVFWELSETDGQQELSEYEPPNVRHGNAREFWLQKRVAALEALSGPTPAAVGVDVVLDPAPQAQGVVKSRGFTQWLPDLTTCQREFVEAPTDRSIRLRGPAGSGKTLTLSIKAVREVVAARRSGTPIRALFVTHSWSLASEVDQLLMALSEEGPLNEINTLPLVAVAQEILPTGMVPADLQLIGDDSLTGKITQLAEIEEVVEDFIGGDWVTFKGQASPDFVERLEATEPEAKRGLAWDLLVEFGCVLGADGIFPSVNSEQRYIRLPRAPWMMRLKDSGDKRAVYALYVKYYDSLQRRNLLTSDQLLNDFLNYLESFTWNHRRLTDGYDVIFVDEFHLFNALERQILRYLSRDVRSYPRIFMALDPRQSPWDVFFGSADATSSDAVTGDEGMEGVKTVDIPTVHRSSPQILDLIKHIHLDYANLNLDDDWDYSISEVESLATPGPVPSLFVSETFAEEELAIYKAVSEAYSRMHAGGQMALAIVDEDRFRRYRDMISNMGKSDKYSIVSVTSREDIAGLKYHRKSLVVGPAEYLAGLQFDTVLIAGLPSLTPNSPNQGVRRRGALSLLYLAVSRAARDVRIFSNEDSGGVPEVLSRAHEEGVLGLFSTREKG
ncbi:MAG: UvrD-helicase domain-containing protein [Nocardioides sp.]|uniref:UvrD-helicase domain-containing protein n=1 Tax=Nocardioides sp. TaxID=35761 RepID=UPI0023961B76|nr:UvrD-helicase domain-containing protein [Nocardioides sp.]MDE0777898.1 UvrD-helicase domain-containing protein [Nocardioides sp.]